MIGLRFAGALFAATLASATIGQCAPNWVGYGTGAGGGGASVTALAVLPNGGFVVGGTFLSIDGVAATRIAVWNGSGWTPLGTGLDNKVNAVLAGSNGDVVAGGWFRNAGGVPANRVARWNGSQWLAMGSGMNGDVYCLAELPNGDVVAGGTFTTAGGVPAVGVARWNGSTWLPMGLGIDGPGSYLAAMTRLPNGDVVVAGRFTTADGQPANNIAQWNGFGWQPLAGGVNGDVRAVAARANGSVVAGGSFTAADGTAVGHIAEWNGTGWSGLGAGPGAFVVSLGVSAAGDVIASGPFAGNALRWDGASWSSIGFDTMSTNQALAFATLPNGDLLVGGFLPDGIGTNSENLVRWTTNCPALAIPYGTGCTGPGGPLSLVADNLPWAGTTFQATATGLGPASFGMMVLSLGQVAPGVFPINPNLIGIVPGPGLGCDLLVASVDYSEGLVPVAGVATWSLPLAPVQIDPTLPGVTFHLQLVDLDFAAGWVGTHLTNGMTCTVGAF